MIVIEYYEDGKDVVGAVVPDFREEIPSVVQAEEALGRLQSFIGRKAEELDKQPAPASNF